MISLRGGVIIESKDFENKELKLEVAAHCTRQYGIIAFGNSFFSRRGENHRGRGNVVLVEAFNFQLVSCITIKKVLLR